MGYADLGYFPTTSTTKLSGAIDRRGRGSSGVAAGGGPNFAVTTKMLCVLASSARARLRRDVLQHAEFIRRLLFHHGQHAFAAGSECQSGFRVECGGVHTVSDCG